MAWTDQCKVVFKMQADHFVNIQPIESRNVTAVFKKLSTESGIPHNTLKRWYYEKEGEKNKKLDSIRNDTPSETVDNSGSTENNGPDNTDSTDETYPPMCVQCGKKSIEKDRNGKYVGKKSKYYGLCQPFDSATEANEILEELSVKTGIALWSVKTLRVFVSNGIELHFQRHNPNGTGASLYFFRLKDDKRNVLYPEVSLHEQQWLVDQMKITLAHCTIKPKTALVPGCSIEVMEKKATKKGGTSTKWIRLK